MDGSENNVAVKKRLILDNQRSFFSRFGLPFILFVSFIWLNLYEKISNLNSVFYPYEQYDSLLTYLIVSVCLFSLAEYLFFYDSKDRFN